VALRKTLGGEQVFGSLLGDMSAVNHFAPTPDVIIIVVTIDRHPPRF